MREKPYRVLVVDDEPLICEYIQFFLDQDRSFEKVVVANSVSLALQKIQNEEFDLVIIDYYMPGKKGVQFVETIKKSLKYRNLQILLISGHFNTMSLSESIRHGIRHVLVKPFNREKLLTKVHEILEKSPPKPSGGGPVRICN